MEEVEALKEHYRNEIALVRDKEKAAFKELNLAKSIMNEILHDSEERKKEEETRKLRHRIVRANNSSQYIRLLFF